MNLDKTKHCKLCEKIDFNIDYGTKCSITSEPPKFERKCPKINFGENLKSNITEISLEKHLIEEQKINAIGTFIIFLGISLFFFIGGFSIAKYIFDKGYFHPVTIIIMGLGLLTLPKAFGSLNFYFNGRKIVNKKNQELKSILKIYGKDYEIELNVKHIHGTIEHTSKIEIKNIPL